MNSEHRSRLRQAQQLQDSGRPDAAIAAYEEALRIHSAAPDAWYELAWLRKQRGHYQAALDAYDRAVHYGVSAAEEVHLNKAVIYTDFLHDHAAAETALQLALKLNPSYAPAQLNLGNLFEEQGRRAEAQASYEALIAAAPKPDSYAELRLEALARLVLLRQPNSVDDPWLQRLQAAASSTTPMDDSTRANLYFAWGRSLEAIAHYDKAFEAFVEANRYASRGGPPYDPELATRRIDALIAATPRPSTAAVSTDAAGALQPLFICGMFRSGSTLIEQVLAAHPQLAAGGELDFFPRLVSGPLAPYPAALSELSSSAAQAHADRYQAHLRRIVAPEKAQARWFSDKRPDNFLLIGLIKRLFPNAKIIHTTRDPMDNGLSIYLQHLNQRVVPHASNLSAIGHYYGLYHRLMTHWKACYPNDIYDFGYDQFVAEPEPQLRELLTFLGLPWDPSCLDFHRSKSTVKTASYWQVRQPLYRQASGRWRHYGDHLAPLQSALQQAGIRQESSVPLGQR